MRSVAEVAFPVPLRRFFDYRIPDDLLDILRPGHRVWAPFGRRRHQMGMVWRVHEPEAGGRPFEELKPLDGLVDPDPVLDARDRALADWMARRTSCSVGEAVFTVFPLGKKPFPRRPSKRPPLAKETTPSAFEATVEQAAALGILLPAMAARFSYTDADGPSSRPEDRFLIHGVAASGKTEVYRRVISAALEAERGAILLVPEIGLTPQMQDRLRGWFSNELEVWHSHLSAGERARVWRRIVEGDARVVVGARSALFLPMQRLGVIILDEEHDPSYKQDGAPAYHAREAAEEKARLHGALLILGSATPSLESHARATAGEIRRICLRQRVDDQPFPVARLVDMRGEGWYLSNPLVAAIKERLEKKEQSLLFLNRRGYFTHVECRSCGWVAQCPHCQVSLVLHRAGDPLLRCHTCDHTQAHRDQCPACGGTVLKTTGRGTQRVAADLATLFPAARILRWDRDAVGARRGGHEQAYRTVTEGRADIIVGTQMVSQGHDFPQVTLVGVIDADRSLAFPDFRAAERTFQLLMQVGGRSGRAHRPGEVLIQSRHPDHYALRSALNRDYETFAASELDYRREAGYPPFTRLAHAVLRARNDPGAEQAAEDFLRWMGTAPVAQGVDLLGPAPAFHRQKSGWAQWQVVIKGPDPALEQMLERARDYVPPSGIQLFLDVAPEGIP